MDKIGTQRELERIAEPEKIHSILKNHLIGKSMFLKDTDPPAEIKLAAFSNESSNEVIVDTPDMELETGGLVLFRILGRYIEVHCRLLRKDSLDFRYHIAVDEARISRKDRQHLRIPVQESEAYITNIRASKQTIDATLFNIPTSVKVNFSMYEQRLKSMADYVKIDVYSGRGTIFDEVRKKNKTLLIKDTLAPSSYVATSDRYIDYAKYLGVEIANKINDFKLRKIASEIIMPINYLTHDMNEIPLGFIHMQSKSRKYDESTIRQLDGIVQELVSTIQDSNTVHIKEKQTVVNLSRGGLKALITHPELKDYLIRQRGFTFDLLFRMQAPITLFGIIRSAVKNAHNDLMLGIQIAGNSSREGEMKRFQDNVATLEKSLAAKLENRKKMMAKMSQRAPGT